MTTSKDLKEMMLLIAPELPPDIQSAIILLAIRYEKESFKTVLKYLLHQLEVHVGTISLTSYDLLTLNNYASNTPVNDMNGLQNVFYKIITHTMTHPVLKNVHVKRNALEWLLMMVNPDSPLKLFIQSIVSGFIVLLQH